MRVARAHRKARDRLEVLKDPHTPLPDEVVGDNGRTISLGGTNLELYYAGLNHSDSTLVMRLPKERLLFVVDLLPVGSFPGRGMIDFYPLEAEHSIQQILTLDWDRLIPGHPGPGDRLGTKQDAQDQLTLLRDASEAVKVAAREGKCYGSQDPFTPRCHPAALRRRRSRRESVLPDPRPWVLKACCSTTACAARNRASGVLPAIPTVPPTPHPCTG